MFVDNKEQEHFACLFYWLNAGIILIVFSGMILGTTLLLFHWLTPKTCCLNFLDTDQLDRITTVFVSVLATISLQDLYKRLMARKKYT